MTQAIGGTLERVINQDYTTHDKVVDGVTCVQFIYRDLTKEVVRGGKLCFNANPAEQNTHCTLEKGHEGAHSHKLVNEDGYTEFLWGISWISGRSTPGED